MNPGRIHILTLLLLTIAAMGTRHLWNGSAVELILAAVLIVLAGIPHGSLDHKVAQQRNRQLRLPLYLLGYIAAAALYLCVWLVAPGVAFLLFLAVTAWHFGETDSNVFNFRYTSPVVLFLYGTALTCWLLMQDATVLLHWTGILTENSKLALTVVQAAVTVPVLVWLLLIATILLLQVRSWQLLMERLFFLLFLWLVSQTSLLMGFVLYFTGWHSVHALLHVRAAAFSRVNPLRMLLQALPATIGAVAVLVLLGWLSNGAWLSNKALPGLFVLLSILTLPHMTEMHRLYTQKKAEPPPPAT